MSVASTGIEAARSVHAGPLLSELIASGGSLANYLERGGYGRLREVAGASTAGRVVEELERAGLRGRGGGGFPTALKWLQVSQSDSEEKYFVCNAHSGQPGPSKEELLIETAPHRVLEAVSLAGWAVGAGRAFVCIGARYNRAAETLHRALEEALDRGLVGPRAGGPEICLHRTGSGHVGGEETAILEQIAGRAAVPTGKPPTPSRAGLHGAPTVVNNLETVLQAFFILHRGAEEFRAVGTDHSPGTALFSLSGDVARPGLYELPLGESLRTLVVEHGGGPTKGRGLKAVLLGPGGSIVLSPREIDLPLDYDSLADLGGSLGTGGVVAISDRVSALDLATRLASSFHEESCGKCEACAEGTSRIVDLLKGEARADTLLRIVPSGPEAAQAESVLPVVQGSWVATRAAGRNGDGPLERVRKLCDWFEHRGDCGHVGSAATAMRRVLDRFDTELRRNLEEDGE